MQEPIIHPKKDEWVLVTNGINEAFDNGYKGKWSLKHYQLVGKLVQVYGVEQFPSVIVSCYPQKGIEEYLEFPFPYCIQRLGKDIPEGWYPAELPPDVVDEYYYLNHNVYIGLKPDGTLLLVFYHNDVSTWFSYYAGYIARANVEITAYQLVSHFPIKKKVLK